jgi:pimeloyl-ACP methyl ester carboxylesterase
MGGRDRLQDGRLGDASLPQEATLKAVLRQPPEHVQPSALMTWLVATPILSRSVVGKITGRHSEDRVTGSCNYEWGRFVGGMAVKLHSLRFENKSAPALIILHGLLGASRNWSTIGKALKDRFDVHALDLRNHGQSPHADTMRWSELVADVKAYMKANGLEEVILMGHSLGGKIAMKFACEHYQLVKKLVIVDIAAKMYPPYHDAEFRAMKRIKPGALTNRREAEELLKPLVQDWGMRQFLMTNLVNTDLGFVWQVNLEVLHASLQVIRQNSLQSDDHFRGPTLLITGGKSDFVVKGDAEDLKEYFPSLKAVSLPKAGHNVHVEDRKGFLEALGKFL